MSCPSRLFCFWNTNILSQITHWDGIIPASFCSDKKNSNCCNGGSLLRSYRRISVEKGLKKGRPSLSRLLPRHILKLFLVAAQVFPGPIRCIIPAVCSGSVSRHSDRMVNHLSQCLLSQSSWPQTRVWMPIESLSLGSQNDSSINESALGYSAGGPVPADRKLMDLWTGSGPSVCV